MARKIVAGNWKSNGSLQELTAFLSDLSESLEEAHKTTVLLFPPAVYLRDAVAAVEGKLLIGGQTCSSHGSGAYTGEVSAEMLRDVGASWAIVGHSERRSLFRESEESLNRKVKQAFDASLGVIFCVGETLEQRESGQAESIVLQQIQASLDEDLAKRVREGEARLMLAYEPVWAIGTGRTATPEDAESMHLAIRACLHEQFGLDANNTPLLYGGSVNEKNAEALFARDAIDGALVGGASLKVDAFKAIIAAALRKI